MRRLKICSMGLSILLLITGAYSQVPEPEDVLGFQVGSERKVADMFQIIDYFYRLDGTSDRITVEEVGKTTEGNPFIVAIITSEENQKDLDKYQKYQRLLADPRKISEDEAQRMIAEGKTVVMINCSIHASEIGAAQMSMKLAYDLVVGSDPSTMQILNNVILLLIPMHNPDGVQMVVDWYRKHLGTEYEGGRMPWLYHKYVGHDNNRDWYMFTQVESRLTLKVHNAWHPQVIVDMHQMGSTGPRLFVPPYVDPFEPNVDPILRQQVAMMGTFIATELTAQGKAGVAHSIGFDAWTPARAYHHYHGGIRILTEAASVKIATPVTVKAEELRPGMTEASVKMPLPWMGGKWTLQDIVDYDYAAAKAVLTNAAGLRTNWLKNFYRVHKKAVDPGKKPYAFVITKKQRSISTTLDMMEVLILGGVEIHRAVESFSADEHPYPAGTFIIYTAQPYGGFAKTLCEVQKYPEIRETPEGPLKTPYDVVAHTLPLLMDVDVVTVKKPFNAQTVPVEKIEKPRGHIQKSPDRIGYAWGHATNDDLVALNRLMANGHTVLWNAEPFAIGKKTYPSGTMVVLQKESLDTDLEGIIADLHVHFVALKDKPSVQALRLKPVRLGLYKSWTSSMDEGWTRWVLEQYEFRYTSVFDDDIRKGALEKKWDVLLLPDFRDSETIVEGLSDQDVPPEYAGGIGEVGVKNIKDFVRRGGTLITLNSSAQFGIEFLHLGVRDCVAGKDRKEFFIPGSILKVLNDSDHPIAYGFGRDTAIFFRRSPVFAVNEGVSVAKYPARPFLSGWVNGEDFLVDKSAIVDIPYEKGRVILFGFPVLYRGQSHGTFKYLFNAIYYGGSSPGEL
ncbi:MAG: M14 family metallopeptidase [Candidatus Aminicenantes bacterium]